MTPPLIDLHSHVLPGVDDGARDVDEAMEALRELDRQGVERVVATPHFRASLLERPARAAARLDAFDAAHAELSAALEADEELGIELGRACEFKLDAPTVDLSDARLRLDGTSFALVEFAAFQLPPFAGNQLKAVHEGGWTPLLAHPERYFGIETALDRVALWVAGGARLQVNARSLSGGYGPMPRKVGAALLARGLVTCIASDYHARGAPEWPAALELLRTARPIEGDGGAPLDEWIRELVYENPARILRGEPPSSVEARAVDLDSGQRRWGGRRG